MTVEFVEGFRTVITYSPYPGCVKDVVFFLAELTGGSLACQPSEVEEAFFLPFEEAQTALTHASDRKTLQTAEMFLNGGNGHAHSSV